jgi:hypothetical protein
MPQHQEKTKQLREREVEKTKRRREQELRKKQQAQPPARATQPQPQPQQPPQRGTQQAQQPAVILPDYTDRAKKLGELIALYLRGNWNWNDGMQMARQYAPAGTTEAELRAAVLHAAKVQGNVGNLSVRALVQPEVVHPQVNISDLPKQSTLQNVARGLQAPLRSVAAGATQLAGKKNPRGQYGKESGGKPFRAPQSFAESYASDPTFGSALELAFPDAPQWFRVLLGGALDLALDPINLLAVKPVKTVVSTVGKQVGSTRAVQKVAEPVKNVAGAVGTRVMHPTAAKQVAKQAPAGEKVKSLRELGRAMEQVPVYSFTRNVGKDMLELRTQLDEIIQRANEQGINIPKSHNILDFEKYVDELKQTVDGKIAEKLDDVLKQDLNAIDQMEAQIRAVNSELADKVQKLKTEIDERADGWYRQASLIDTHLFFNPDVSDSVPIRKSMWEGARAVFRREILPSKNVIYRTIDAWKRTKTIYNPATHTRNFFQNFLFRYLTGDVDVADLLRLPTAVRDMIRFRRMVDDIARQGDNFTLTDIMNRYPEFADLVYILSANKNRPSVRGFIQQLREATFDHPSYRARTQAMLDLNDTIRAGKLAHEAGIPISQLPRNPIDVLLFPFRRVAEITREVRAKDQPRWYKPLDWLHTIAFRAYNAGDVIPALLMEAISKRKQIQSLREMQKRIPREQFEMMLDNLPQNPFIVILEQLYPSSKFRMDYSAVPETIGMFNIALLPFVNYQYFALRGLREALRKNPERVYNIIAKPIERSTRITQADDEQGVSQAPRFGFAEREMYPVSATRGVPYSTILPIDPQFAEPLLSLSGWVSRSPITAIARPFVENRDDTKRMVNQLIREFTPATFTHLAYALLGEPQRGMQPTLQHTRLERLLRAIGINIQPIDQMRIARQQQREAERKRNEPLYDDPATITGIVQRILRSLGW